MTRAIFTGYAPTEGRAQMILAAKQFLPWKWTDWRGQSHVLAIETWLKNYFGGASVQAVDSGRTALQLLLETQKLKPGDEVLVQAYTCLVVVNAIRWAGGTPIFVDVTSDFTMDPNDAARKISPRTRVLLIQHTFGIPADTTTLLRLATKHALFTIEDCAHALGVRTNTGSLLGTMATAAIISFGSDKVISAGRGGAIITNDKKLAKAVNKRIKQLPKIPISYLVPHLLRVIWFYIGKNTYHLGLGKWLMALTAKLGLSNRIIYANEKTGTNQSPFPTKWPNALAALIEQQIKALDRIQSKRSMQTNRYAQEVTNQALVIPPSAMNGPLLRVPALVTNPIAWHQAAQQQGIYLGNWYDTVIAPADATGVSGYIPGSCPMAERLAAQSINLPTGPWFSATDQNRVIAFINSFQP